jgi:hypothetical protein
VFRGVILLLHVRNVTAVDFDDNDFPHYDLTLQTLTWDPTSNVYGVQERVKERDMMNLYGDIETRRPFMPHCPLASQSWAWTLALTGNVCAYKAKQTLTKMTQRGVCHNLTHGLNMTDHDRPGTPLQTPTLLLQKQRVIVSANVGIVTASQLTNDTTSLTQTMTDHD